MANHWLDINHDYFSFGILPDHFLQDTGENTHPAPAEPTIVKGLVLPMVPRCVTGKNGFSHTICSSVSP